MMLSGLEGVGTLQDGVQNRKLQGLRGKYPSSCATPATAYALDFAIGHQSPTPPEILIVNLSSSIRWSQVMLVPSFQRALRMCVFRAGKQVSPCDRVVVGHQHWRHLDHAGVLDHLLRWPFDHYDTAWLLLFELLSPTKCFIFTPRTVTDDFYQFHPIGALGDRDGSTLVLNSQMRLVLVRISSSRQHYRNLHEQQHGTIEESTKRVWTACVMQVRAVAHRMRTLQGEKINATCLSQLLSVLERQDLSRQLEAWATARLYFDGGARGNPGPGGSGWALIFLNERSNRWELKACGYAYMGTEVTNNWCEYSALKDGLAYSAHCLQHYEVKLEVFGDSQMMIAAQNGFSSIRQTEL
ncbi:hypothetical protein FI667_g7618, partial [Globisporangium splendens]